MSEEQMATQLEETIQADGMVMVGVMRREIGLCPERR
jgi:hypothetical protein